MSDLARKEKFRKWSHSIAESVGSPNAFSMALATILIWLITGPFFHYSDTWQLMINTSTTIVTFLMVFLIQNSQNRDAKVFHLKLDELIRAVRGARTELVSLEDLTEEELDKLHREFQEMHTKILAKIKDTEKSKIHRMDNSDR